MKHWFLVALIAATVGMCAYTFEPTENVESIFYTVQTGDTVWEIAERYAGAQCKPFNEFVWIIGDKNNLAGKYIKPGDVLVIPLYTRAKKEARPNGEYK